MLKDYLGMPDFIESIGYIYPISIVDYDKFKKLSSRYLMIDKNNLESEIGEKIEESSFEIILTQIKCFEISCDKNLLNIMDQETSNYYEQFKNIKDKLTIDEFQDLLKLILKKDKVYYDEEEMMFIIDDGLETKYINKDNFEKLKKIVMRQNLLFAPLYYEDPILQGLLESLRTNETKGQDSYEFDLESILQLISIKKGINPKELIVYTYYQIMAECSRIQKIENYEWVKSIQTSGYGNKDQEIPKMDEKINLNKHPESDMIKFNSSVYENAESIS
ncbi:MAG: hypothetical protein RSA91_01065 [Bacilli bacterium]